MRGINSRVAPELYDILNQRRLKFNTSLSTEQRNLVKIIKEFETKLGFNIKDTIVTKDGAQINTKRKLFVLK